MIYLHIIQLRFNKEQSCFSRSVCTSYVNIVGKLMKDFINPKVQQKGWLDLHYTCYILPYSRNVGILNLKMAISRLKSVYYDKRKDYLGDPLGFPFNIYTMAEVSDFKFGTHLGFANAHHKTTPYRKYMLGLVLAQIFKLFWFHFNIYTMAQASDFKFGKQLRFANIHRKTTPSGIVGVTLGYESPDILGFPSCPLSVS